jgi:hypothetical protein
MFSPSMYNIVQTDLPICKSEMLNAVRVSDSHSQNSCSGVSGGAVEDPERISQRASPLVAERREERRAGPSLWGHAFHYGVGLRCVSTMF